MSFQQELLDLGKLLVAQVHLKSDLSFAYNISVDGKQIFAASGIWQRKGNELYWTYAYRVLCPSLRRVAGR
ncbi:hypothetical protein [Pseudomonas sp. SCB32]|uniref:hypothetical protein n=1 Tax=Pseudomonas sp. SCB32 TaxID=2653853 RepID=UPI00126412B8|nr:hypothetical protein [Pseudomonas sp. SCB32]